MTIKSQIQTDIALFFDLDEFAEEVSILDSSESSLAANVPCNFVDGNFLDSFPTKSKHSAKCYIPVSYHPSGKFSIGEKIEREGEIGVIWRIEKISMVEFGVAHLEVRTDSRGF